MKLWPIQQRERKAWKPRENQKIKKWIANPNIDMAYNERDEIYDRVCGKKGDPYCKIIARGSDEKHEYTLHATKGYRRGRK